MDNLKLTIDLLPKGAWDNDLSIILPKKDWDLLRKFCYERANNRCQICGEYTDDLDAHEVWQFDEKHKTQTLKDIIGICKKCHGVIHFKNSVRLGYGQEAKEHFIKVNQCSEMDFANHLNRALLEYEERNKVYRWNMDVDLSKLGGKDMAFKQRLIPLITSPYEGIDWINLKFDDLNEMFKVSKSDSLVGPPRIISLTINNYQGVITIKSLFTDKVEWFLDGNKIKTKYNVVGNFTTTFHVEGLEGEKLNFKISNANGYLISKDFILKNS